MARAASVVTKAEAESSHQAAPGPMVGAGGPAALVVATAAAVDSEGGLASVAAAVSGTVVAAWEEEVDRKAEVASTRRGVQETEEVRLAEVAQEAVAEAAASARWGR